MLGFGLTKKQKHLKHVLLFPGKLIDFQILLMKQTSIIQENY